MKTRLVWITAIVLLAALIATGCSMVPGVEHEQAAKTEPLDAAAWPTPEPSATLPAPTPFPKITLAPTATSMPAPTAVAEATPTPLSAGGLTYSGSVSDLQAEVSALTGGFEPVAVAFVSAATETVRQGPGGGFASTGAVAAGELAGVLGMNGGGDWLYVITISGTQGWLPLDSLRVTGSLDDAPVLPDNPLAAVSAREDAAEADVPSAGDVPTGAPSSASGEAAVVEEVAAFSVPSMTEVASAVVKAPQSKLYRAPSSDAAPVEDVYVDESVSVLALNSDRSWALVKPVEKTPGWTSLSNVSLSGSLEAAPSVQTAWVESNGVQVRSGPGVYYDQVGTLAVNDLVALLGQSENQGWALVKPILGGGAGWTPFHYLDIDGSWNDVPKLAADVLGGEETAAASAPALPAPAGAPTGTLALQMGSGGDIMLIAADGSGLRRLTDGIDPMLSPDGAQVAFTRWEYGGESSALWVINTDGSGERAVLGEMRKAKGPDWSPDGKRIILNHQDGGRLEPKKECQLLIDMETGDKAKISLPANAYDVEVEIRDGLPYMCWKLPPDAYWSLRVVNLTDGSYEGVYGGQYAFRPSWDLTSDWRVVVDSGYGLLETDANETEASASRGLTDEQGEGSPTISPDGRFIASVVNAAGAYDIYRLNADGSGRVRLTETPLWVTGRGLERWNNVAPAWSPDSAYIAFLTDRAGRWEVWVMNADGSNPHPLFSEETNDQMPIQYDFNDERVISWR
jgi:uncharacterized protein YgiM (DUF1202 family)